MKVHFTLKLLFSISKFLRCIFKEGFFCLLYNKPKYKASVNIIKNNIYVLRGGSNFEPKT